ncbi:DJ-1/PfpI family protein [Photobacterium japonica]|uniref:DJ-1/PfpI family protein n=1 Tax=Photobacterium japonica TaxID=2910235 RepID=UPI003D0B921F
MSEIPQPAEKPQYTIAILLYEGVDLLTTSTAITTFKQHPDVFEVQLLSEQGLAICSQQGVSLAADKDCLTATSYDILIVPGGQGVQAALDSAVLMAWLRQQTYPLRYVCGLGTGAALLAQAGLLTDYAATTDKRHFHWVSGFGEGINWCPVARWVQDEHRFTASGGMATLDMCLALIAHFMNEDTARKTAIALEYIWINDPDDDPFAPLHIVN